MGQRQTTIPPESTTLYSLFQTPFGWWSIVGQDKLLKRLYCGYSTYGNLLEAIHLDFNEGVNSQTKRREQDWFPELRHKLERYARGCREEFREIQLDLPALTPFQKKVLQVTRKIPIGRTLTYGELAERAGFPRAFRAVGSVMAANRFPIVIPCHRVTAAGGKIGGYTNPVGVTLKERLLLLEQEMVAEKKS